MKTTLQGTALLLLALLLVVAPGQAAVQGGPGGPGGEAFKLYGQITWLDSGAGTIQVEVTAPESLKQFSPITVRTNGDTRLRECNEGAAPASINFDDLEVGRMVKVAGEMAGADYVAVSVILY